MKSKLLVVVIITLIFFLLLVSCSKNKETVSIIDSEDMPEQISQETEVEEQPDSSNIDFRKIKPNEAGQVMVLMYHSIGEEEKEFTRTPENFWKDLEILYEKGYRPISLKDYAEGNIDIEAGFSPVVITFDDGNQNQFNIISEEGGTYTIDPQCAVGILIDFHEKHPDFPLKATFFVNGGVPFGQKEYLDYKLNFLVDQGMDIGNHTASHFDFTNCTDSKSIENEIWTVKEKVEDIVRGYKVETLSLPYGSKPKKDESLFQYIVEGKEHSYYNIAIVEVGWDPYKSPYTVDFNPFGIHRVRASDLQEYVKGTGIYDWIDRLEKGERPKYISDGDPDKVTIPEEYKEQIDLQKIGDRDVVTYILEDSE